MNSDLELLIFVMKALYFGITFILAVYLLFRAYKTGYVNILLLSIGFFMMLTEWFLYFLEAPLFLQNIFSLLFPIFLVLFVKLTFYRNLHCGFRTILSIVILGKILNFILKAQFGFNVPPSIPVTNDLIPFYILHMVVALSSEFIGRGWLAYAAFTNAQRLSKYEIEPWIIKRYQMFYVAAFLHSINLVLSIFLPIDGTGYEFHTFAVGIGVLQTIETLIFASLLSIAIIMPMKLKVWFNRNFPVMDAAITNISEEQVLLQLKDEEGIS